jgi:hypothetical protein
MQGVRGRLGLQQGARTRFDYAIDSLRWALLEVRPAEGDAAELREESLEKRRR